MYIDSVFNCSVSRPRKLSFAIFIIRTAYAKRKISLYNLAYLKLSYRYLEVRIYNRIIQKSTFEETFKFTVDFFIGAVWGILKPHVI